MGAAAFDTLAAVRALEATGIERGQAEAIADAIRAGHSDLGTKADLAHFATKADLANAIAGLERRSIGYGAAGLGLLFGALKLLFRLLLLTGCRRSEILTLRWDDVDRTAGELRLRDAKAGPRMVPLTRPLAAVLDGIARVSGNPWVVVGKRRNGRLTNLDPCWQPIRAKAGLEDVRIHDLRHSYASRALALGESLPAIGKLLGHRKVSTTARYVHLMQGAAKAAASRVGDSIGAHLETRSAEAA